MTDVALLSRYTQDVGFDTRAYARYIGNLEDGRSKVSVNTSLSVGDRQDNFRFRMTADGFARISTGELVGKDGTGFDVAQDGTVRYQLLSASGRVIADSKSGSGEAYDNWVKLTSDTNLQLTKGTYTLNASRGPAAVDNKEYVYSFTLKSNRDRITADSTDFASREFLTTETPAPAGAVFDQYASVSAVLGLFVNVQVI